MHSSHSLILGIVAYGALSVFAGIVMHELGHLVAARMLGIKVLSVSIGFGFELIGFTDSQGTRWKLAPLLLGGICNFEDNDVRNADLSARPTGRRSLAGTSPQERAIICAAGPTFNLLFAGAIMLFEFHHPGILTSSEDMKIHLSESLITVSLAMGLFNLLPLPPLDGGRLVLIAIEAVRAVPFTKLGEKRILTIGSYALASMSVLIFLLFIFCLEESPHIF